MSNKYEATGTLRAIMATQAISDSFRKREFALEIPDGNYTQTIKFQVVQDKTELLDSFEVGQQVKVAFNLRGREFTRKTDGATDYWVNLDCWRIEPLSESGGGSGPANDTGSFRTDEPSDDDFDMDPPF
jgi:hypothetical protein